MSGVTEPLNKPSCGDGKCEYTVDLPTAICQQQTVIYVTVSATNIFGVGPSSAQFITGIYSRIILVQCRNEKLIIIMYTMSQKFVVTLVVQYNLSYHNILMQLHELKYY